MLTRLRIQNFKAWQDTGGIRLAPLTVFFGTNSSGKTSLLQFLLMLKQTVLSPDRRRVLNFGDSRSLVDLGVWPEMIFRHDAGRVLSFNLEWLGPTDPEMPDDEQDLQPLRFEAKVGRPEDEQATVELNSFKYQLRPRSKDSFVLGIERTGSGKYRLESSHRRRSLKILDLSAPPAHFHSLAFERLGKAAHSEAIFDLQRLQLLLEGELDSILYLGPIRVGPSRLYVWAGDPPEDVGVEGEETIAALLAAPNQPFKLANHQAETSLQMIVASWLQQLGILESFEIRAIAPHRKEYEVFVRAAGMKDAVNLTDVGFGVSQVLPVLVQLLYVERRSTLIFEQPELHLHPRAQSALADIFIDALQMQEEGHPREVQLLVESHSEHLLRRLQRRVAENKLTPDQVALYFCKPGPEGSTIEELKLDEYGNISNWPENFFGDEVGDLAAMTEAAMRRHLGEEES